MSHKKIKRIDPLEKRLPLVGIDSHAHLDDKIFDADRAEVIDRATQVGVANICNVFLGPDEYNAHKQYFATCPNIFYIMGIHPCDGLRCGSNTLDEMRDIFAKEKRLRAVGEIGLDFHWNDCPREIQMRVFASQMELAKDLGKPVVIHCREAEDDCLTILEAGGFKNYPLLWHCFGGNAGLAKRILHNGWHISIPGPVTFPANEDLRKAVAIIPDDRLLLETDCPYLSPVPWRGTRNEPAYVVFTAEACAKVRNVDVNDLWQQCGQNAKNFFGLE